MSSLFPPDAPAPPPAHPSAVIPVSALVGRMRLLLERQIGLVWVGGEVSNFTRAASGHCYFNLKDGAAQVRCVLFRSKAQLASFALANGQSVEVRAVASVYEPRGELQLNVDTVRLAGVGALYERFERMKARLADAGWFAAERKRALPAYPRAVGIVTSLHAAALRDILTTLRRRSPALSIVIYPAAVQGDGASWEIARAIGAASKHARVDVLIVARGGGSIEDLWAFNEEPVARAVYQSAIPVVSGVGHETDFTICDFVADVRAPTPTGAATLVVRDRQGVLTALAEVARHCRRAHRHALETRMQRVDALARRLVHPAAKLAQQRRETAALATRLQRAYRGAASARQADVADGARRYARLLRMPPAQSARPAELGAALARAARLRLEHARMRVAALERSLGHLDPRQVLERGYAIVTAADGAIVDDAARLSVGDDVTLRFGRGSADAKVTGRR